MTAIAIRKPGGPELLAAQQQPVPTPAKGEILVKVAASTGQT
jgi:NADPH2:quinone reductase